MKDYPSIPRSDKAPLNEPCIAFHKYDGSNLRWEWSRKRGWYKFGTRHRLFDRTDPDFGPAIGLFMETLGPPLEAKFQAYFRGVDTITVFTEWFGPRSFAGQHMSDDPKELRLLDVCPLKKCMVSAAEFVELFGELPFAAQVVYQGPLTEQFVLDVRTGKYPVVEGVVCKGGSRHDLWMVKIKTDAYKKCLVETFKEGWQNFWE